MSISIGDIEAAGDVITQLTNEIDDLTTEQAIALHEAMTKLQKIAKLAAELLETKAVNLLDGQPAKVGDKFYAPSASGTGKWRPNHGKIRTLIVERSVSEATDPETGDINPRAAVREALDLVYSGWVSDSKMPTQRMLQALDVDNKVVADFERGRQRLKVIGEETGSDDD